MLPASNVIIDSFIHHAIAYITSQYDFGSVADFLLLWVWEREYRGLNGISKRVTRV